jgi:RsmE family RNA methyltransferase
VNSLLLLPSECLSAEKAELSGARALYAYDTHGIRAGQTVRVGVLGGLKGEAKVVSATQSAIALDLSLSETSLPSEPIDLIVGVSRPQTIKKVIQAAVMLGVRSLHFVRSEQGEKSYLQSRSLDEDQILDESTKALEQVWDTRAPEIHVHRTFSYFLEKKYPGLVSGVAHAHSLVAHPSGEPLVVADGSHFASSHVVVAIGPERGWSAQEIELFTQAGFKVIGLGERVVRVEIALVLLMGQLQLLRR